MMRAMATAGTLAQDNLLRTLVEAVEAETGESFFRSLVRHLALALGARYAFVSELTQSLGVILTASCQTFIQLCTLYVDVYH